MVTHDWVLVEVVVGAARDSVELHEIVEIGYLPPDPFLGQS